MKPQKNLKFDRPEFNEYSKLWGISFLCAYFGETAMSTFTLNKYNVIINVVILCSICSRLLSFRNNQKITLDDVVYLFCTDFSWPSTDGTLFLIFIFHFPFIWLFEQRFYSNELNCTLCQA